LAEPTGVTMSDVHASPPVLAYVRDLSAPFGNGSSRSGRGVPAWLGCAGRIPSGVPAMSTCWPLSRGRPGRRPRGRGDGPRRRRRMSGPRPGGERDHRRDRGGDRRLPVRGPRQHDRSRGRDRAWRRTPRRDQPGQSDRRHHVGPRARTITRVPSNASTSTTSPSKTSRAPGASASTCPVTGPLLPDVTGVSADSGRSSSATSRPDHSRCRHHGTGQAR
jgi:hypothetical protein